MSEIFYSVKSRGFLDAADARADQRPMDPAIPVARLAVFGARASRETRDVRRIKDMKKNAKPSTSSVSSANTDHVGKPAAASQAQDESPSANDLGQGIDRPGFDLGGSSGDTHAGTWLPLANDAFDAPGERRLPGRRFDNDLTIPRWGGPHPHDRTASDKKTEGAKTPSPPDTKKAR